MHPRIPSAGLLALALGVVSCTSPEGQGPDADRGDATRDVGREGEVGLDASDGEAGSADGSGSEESRAAPEPGAVTLVSERISALTDRHCDLDGDGIGDNAIADLGLPASTVFTAFLDNVFETAIGAGHDRIMARFPRLEDRRGPDHPGEVPLLLFEGEDSDEPRDSSDDFSGDEVLLVSGRSVDACGEPAHPMSGARLSDGVLTGASGLLPIPLDHDAFIGFAAELVDGTVESWGAAAALRACGGATISQLGELADYRNGLSVLEVFLSGGTALGVPTVPGLSPDVDVDGDGLERYELSEEGEILRCIDGDDRIIEGRDCWRDPAMADSFSIVLRMDGVSARFGGRHELWANEVSGSCESPPSESLWSECSVDADCPAGESCAELPDPGSEGILLCQSP